MCWNLITIWLLNVLGRLLDELIKLVWANSKYLTYYQSKFVNWNKTCTKPSNGHFIYLAHQCYLFKIYRSCWILQYRENTFSRVISDSVEGFNSVNHETNIRALKNEHFIYLADQWCLFKLCRSYSTEEKPSPGLFLAAMKVWIR